MNSKTTRTAPPAPAGKQAGTKLESIEALLGRTEGATIADMTGATGWQQHSVRGAIAGAMKKRGHIITSEKVDGLRRYRIAAPK